MEIKALRKTHQQHSDQLKRFKQITYPKRNRLTFSKQSNNQNTVQEQEEIERNEAENSTLQLEGGGESTFMRVTKVTQNEESAPNENEVQMRQSLGANLLQMMQFNNQNKKSKRAVRNFNFRCNLQEIDKIIEEDTSECQRLQDTPVQDNEQAQEEIKEINNNIEEEQQQKQRSSSITKRPNTGVKIQRRAWGINPRKSLKKRQSKERPRTAAQGGIRVKGVPISKNEHEDPILALLREEQEQSEINPNELTINETQNKEILDEINTSDKTLKISDLNLSEGKQVLNEDLPQKPIVEEIKEVPVKRKQQPVKRGMFKAPPPNLIEQLLFDDSTEQTQQPTPPQQVEVQKVSPKNIHFIRENKFMKVNNFLQKRQKSNSRSKSRTNKNNKFPGIADLCDDDEEEKLQDQEENPFHSESTLTKNANNNNDSENNMINLFFHRKKGSGNGDTAEFGK